MSYSSEPEDLCMLYSLQISWSSLCRWVPASTCTCSSRHLHMYILCCGPSTAAHTCIFTSTSCKEGSGVKTMSKCEYSHSYMINDHLLWWYWYRQIWDGCLWQYGMLVLVKISHICLILIVRSHEHAESLVPKESKQLDIGSIFNFPLCNSRWIRSADWISGNLYVWRKYNYS